MIDCLATDRPNWFSLLMVLPVGTYSIRHSKNDKLAYLSTILSRFIDYELEVKSESYKVTVIVYTG